ncbi:MAG TPA: FtsX-like permease family protein [Steroidobacteraceae bacterium]|nr:FtsX-like permease family protein [Steroidobacteraceae bacterium]
MKYLHLLWSNLGRKKLRTWLTLASIVVAFLLFGVLQTMRAALTGGADLAGVDRLMTTHKVSLIQPLPESYLTRVRGLDGVRVATSQDWFGGVYQDDRNQIVAIAVDAPSFLDVYPELQLKPEERSAWLNDRQGAIVGTLIAKRFGWNVGDTIPMRSNIFTNKDGTQSWPMKISGIFTSTNGDLSSVYFHHEYLNEARSFGRDTIGWIVMRIKNPDDAAKMAAKVDALFANSETETKTATEKAFAQAFANQMGNIGALVTAVASAVFFTMLLVIANTMGQSVRERTNELAVMKTLGFSSASVTGLVIGESLLITLLGAAIGLLIAGGASVGIGQALQNFFPSLGMPRSTFAIGFAIALLLGIVASALPATQAWRLKIVEALRRI